VWARPHSKIDRALQTDTRATGLRVIVRTRQNALDLVTNQERRKGHQVGHLHRLIDGAALTLTRKELDALESDPNVVSISADSIVKTTGDWSSTTTIPTQFDTLAAPRGYTGRGVGVAIVDSGLEPSSDFPSVYFRDFVNGRTTPYDDYGHGTHVAGLIASRGYLSNGLYRGVAKYARLVVLKALDGQGAARTSTIISALEFAVANKASLGIDIINLSLGHPVYESPDTDPLVAAVEAAVRAGITVVVSAGNAGRNPATNQVWYGGILSPGNSPSAITVGAADTSQTVSRGDDTVPAYSSRGPTRFAGLLKPDFLAPGHSLVSDAALNGSLYARYPDKLVSLGDTPRFMRLNGTSMAAAVTSGVVALMVEASRTRFGAALSPHAMKALLEYSALPLPDADRPSQGAGELNAAGAVKLAYSIDPRVAPGEWWLVDAIDPSSTIGTDTLAWTQAVLWGNTLVDGSVAFINEPAWDASLVWGAGDDTVVWGNSDDGGDTVVWGNSENDDTVVWGNSDDTVVWGNTEDDTVVWGNNDDDTVVWGNSVP
jgi:serine protease AprX